MGVYSDKAAIAVCDRCNFKMKITELRADGNTPALRVCVDCWDPIDPWRLPPLRPDTIALQKPRPDVYIGLNAPPTEIKWNTPGLKWNQPGLVWDETIAGGSQ